jgi:hypothetical protein
MKTRSVILPAILLLSIVNGCKKDSVNTGVPYYRFTEDDKSKLLVDYTVGKELVYKNQDNEEIGFRVASYTNGKTPYATGTFWGESTSVYFYYDQQETIMQYTEIPTAAYNCEINLKRYPTGSNYNLQYPIEGTPEFTGYIQFPLWNKYNDTLTLDNAIPLNFDSPVITVTINGRTYPNVIILESGTTNILEPNNTFPALPRNVNRIYYDKHYGIIGFDDLNGKAWRLQ